MAGYPKPAGTFVYRTSSTNLPSVGVVDIQRPATWGGMVVRSPKRSSYSRHTPEKGHPRQGSDSGYEGSSPAASPSPGAVSDNRRMGSYSISSNTPDVSNRPPTSSQAALNARANINSGASAAANGRASNNKDNLPLPLMQKFRTVVSISSNADRNHVFQADRHAATSQINRGAANRASAEVLANSLVDTGRGSSSGSGSRPLVAVSPSSTLAATSTIRNSPPSPYTAHHVDNTNPDAVHTRSGRENSRAGRCEGRKTADLSVANNSGCSGRSPTTVSPPSRTNAQAARVQHTGETGDRARRALSAEGDANNTRLVTPIAFTHPYSPTTNGHACKTIHPDSGGEDNNNNNSSCSRNGQATKGTRSSTYGKTSRVLTLDTDTTTGLTPARLVASNMRSEIAHQSRSRTPPPVPPKGIHASSRTKPAENDSKPTANGQLSGHQDGPSYGNGYGQTSIGEVHPSSPASANIDGYDNPARWDISGGSMTDARSDGTDSDTWSLSTLSSISESLPSFEPYRFHMDGHHTAVDGGGAERTGGGDGGGGGGGGPDDNKESHPFLVARRDVFNPSASQEMRIVSSKGTVRGFKNRVRAGIASFVEKDGEEKKNYRLLEKGKIVMYTTSMMIVRDTHEKCIKVRKILVNHMVQFDEKDIVMSRDNQSELMERLDTDQMDVPQVFADGQHIGGADEIDRLNETGELRKILKHFKHVRLVTSCEQCGGYRYIPCTACHGCKRSLHRNHFTEEFCALRCIVCDENGLVRCETCNSVKS